MRRRRILRVEVGRAMTVCDGAKRDCPSRDGHDEIVFDGSARDCPLGKALQDLEAANERADEAEERARELEAEA